MRSPAEPVAVIGMACRFPGAQCPEQLWANLTGGVDCITRSAGGSASEVRAVGHVEAVECFDADYFRVPPGDALLMDPQHRVLLEVAAAALQDAGYGGRIDDEVGVFVGSGVNHYHSEFLAPRDGRASTEDVRVALLNEKDFLAARLAFKLRLRGPSLTVQTACSTSLTAVATACQAIQAGECDMAIAGGVSLIMPDVESYRHVEGGIYAADGYCRAFDAHASGTVPSSGAAVVVLKRDETARADRDCRRAVIRGWAINNDGGTGAGFTAPSVKGQAAVIRRAMARAGVRPRDVGLVEAHGTGTLLGDQVEVEALRSVFAEDDWEPGSCVLGAVKSNIGHTDAAAGVAGLIKATLAVECGTIPGTAHLRAPNPDLRIEETPFRLNEGNVTWHTSTADRVAGVSSFGIGGSNAHVVVQGADVDAATPDERRRQVLVLSARSDEKLAEVRDALATWFERHPDLGPADLADISHTLACGRPSLASRWFCTAATVEEAISALRAPMQAERPGARRILTVHGAPAEFASASAAPLDDPGVRAALQELVRAVPSLAGADPLAGLPDDCLAEWGALLAVAQARTLHAYGVTVARSDVPAWMQPLEPWFDPTRDATGVAEALGASKNARGSAREPAGQGTTVTLAPCTATATALGAAWCLGADIRWERYFAASPRRRVPLPTYPFARTRFWLDRPAVGDASAASDGNRAGPRVALEVVASTWCSVLGLESVPHDADFVDDLDGDSLLAVEIVAQLSDRYGIDLPGDLILTASTVSAMAAAVDEALAHRAQ